MSTKKECDGGTETYKGSLATVDDCALACKGISLWFTFATNEVGNDYCKDGCCNDGKCQCYCESGTGDSPSCAQTDHNGYNLYSFLKEGNNQDKIKDQDNIQDKFLSNLMLYNII